MEQPASDAEWSDLIWALEREHSGAAPTEPGATSAQVSPLNWNAKADVEPSELEMKSKKGASWSVNEELRSMNRSRGLPDAGRSE